jgi:hypothetical protein
VIGGESGEVRFLVEIFFQPLKLLLGQGWEWLRLLGSDDDLSCEWVKNHGS